MTQDEFKKIILDKLTTDQRTKWIPLGDIQAVVNVTFETLKKLSEGIK